MKVIGFVNQKGGVGKTTLGMLTCTAFSEKPYGYKVAMIDCDAQQSARMQREKDIFTISEDLAYKKAEIELKKNGSLKNDDLEVLAQKYLLAIRHEMSENESKYFPYPIFFSEVENLTETMVKLEEQGEYDYVFIDMPGQAQGAGLSTLLISLDYAFVPLESGNFDISSSVDFITKKMKVFKQWKENQGEFAKLEISIVFNKVEETKMYTELSEGMYGVYGNDPAVKLFDKDKCLTRSVFYKENCNTYQSALNIKAKDSREKGMQARFKLFMDEVDSNINSFKRIMAEMQSNINKK